MIQTDEQGNWIPRPPLTAAEELQIEAATARLKARRRAFWALKLAPVIQGPKGSKVSRFIQPKIYTERTYAPVPRRYR